MDSSLDSKSRHKCLIALEQILKNCDDFNVLEKLLTPTIPTEIMMFILEKISKVFLVDFHILYVLSDIT